jgi:hypothetical protein
LLKAVRHHTDCPWVLLYIERWLKAPVEMADGRVVPCTAGTPHPTKTMLVYCKDTDRRGDFPVQSFDFLGYTFRSRQAVWHGSRYVTSFLPASPKALTEVRQTIRRWALHHRTDKSLEDVARMFRPYIQGWINYYSHFYKSALTPTLHRIDAFLVRNVQAFCAPALRGFCCFLQLRQ